MSTKAPVWESKAGIVPPPACRGMFRYAFGAAHDVMPKAAAEPAQLIGAAATPAQTANAANADLKLSNRTSKSAEGRTLRVREPSIACQTATGGERSSADSQRSGKSPDWYSVRCPRCQKRSNRDFR